MHHFIIDLDGTIYAGNAPLPYAGEFISRLNEGGIPYVFLTNSPERSPRVIERMLRTLSVPAKAGSVLTSGMLAVEHLKKEAAKGRDRVFVLGGGYLKRHAAANGLVLTQDRPDFVLAAYAEEVSLRDVNIACRQIGNGAGFVATNADDVIPILDGFQPNTGILINAITAATGVRPHIVGKPSGQLAARFMQMFHCGAEEISVIGDRLDMDMLFARNCGFSSRLVLTGLTSEADALRHRDAFDHCYRDLCQLRENVLIDGGL